MNNTLFNKILEENRKLIDKYRKELIEQKKLLEQYDIMYEMKCMELNNYIIKYNRNRVLLEIEHIKNMN
jgi:hypothetical protein